MHRRGLVRYRNECRGLVGCGLMRIVRMLGDLGSCREQRRRMNRRMCRIIFMGSHVHVRRGCCMRRHRDDLYSSLGRSGRMQRGHGRLDKGRKSGRMQSGGRDIVFCGRRGLCRSATDRCRAWRGGGVLGSGVGSGWHRRSSIPQVWPEACAAACACFNSLGSCRLILRNSLATPASKWQY